VPTKQEPLWLLFRFLVSCNKVVTIILQPLALLNGFISKNANSAKIILLLLRGVK
jgi:hypothetical protein